MLYKTGSGIHHLMTSNDETDVNMYQRTRRSGGDCHKLSQEEVMKSTTDAAREKIENTRTP